MTKIPGVRYDKLYFVYYIFPNFVRLIFSGNICDFTIAYLSYRTSVKYIRFKMISFKFTQTTHLRPTFLTKYGNTQIATIT